MSRIGNMIKRSQTNILKGYELSLNSRVLLYFILFLTMGDLIYFSIDGDMLFIFIYLAVGFLTSFFSKNMIVIMVIAMTVTHILRLGKHNNEGMENQEDYNGNNPISDFQKIEEEYDLNDLTSKTENFTGPPPSSSLPKSSVPTGSKIDTDKDILNKVVKSLQKTNNNSANPAASSSIPTSTTVKNSNVSHGPSSAPAPINALKKATAEIDRIKKELNTSNAKHLSVPNGASNSEMLKMLGVDNSPTVNNNKPIVNSGFDNLDTQTQKLLNTQKELMTNMENLSPLLAQAEKFMDKFKGLS